MYFVLGDYMAGMLIGVATAFGVRALVWPGMDMVIAMLLGMAIGMVIHILLGFAFAPVLGMFQTMFPAAIIGMYGGMFFGMRDSMAAGSTTWRAAAVVGALFGAVVVLSIKVYDHSLRGPVVDTGE